jgi:hypothetical protein
MPKGSKKNKTIELMEPQDHQVQYFKDMYPDLELNYNEEQDFIEEDDSSFFEEPRRIYVLISNKTPQFYTSEYLDGNVAETWKGLAESIFG